MDVRGKLRNAFEEILDKMAFLYFEEPGEGDTEEVADGPYDFLTQIEFSGVVNGTLNLFLVRSSAEQVARNLVGIREEDELFDTTLQDAILELTNMVMGRTMTTMDPSHGFEMGVPKVVQEPSSGGDGDSREVILGNLDDVPCKILIHYKS